MRYWRVDFKESDKSFVIPMNDVFRCNLMLKKDKVKIYPWRDWKPNNQNLFCTLFDVENYRLWEKENCLKKDIVNFIEGL